MSARVVRVAAVIAAVVVIGAGWSWLAGLRSPTPVETAGTAPTATVSAPAQVTAEATPNPAATVVTASDLCVPANLVAQITGWDGAAGHRIATVELRNAGSTSCEWPTMDQPQLVDGGGAILISGAPAAAGATLTLSSGDVVTAIVQDGNYCFQVPIAPVTVAFVMPGGTGRIVAAPVSSSDITGIPPCNGAAGSAGSIEMQPWTR